jgi:Xaa-Pro aminopeptidase
MAALSEYREIRAAMRDFYPRFSDEEFRRRHALATDLMDELGLSCLLVYGDSGHCYMNQANVRWLANYADHQYNYVVLPRDAEPTLFMSIPNMQPGAAAISAIEDVRWSVGGRRDLAGSVAARVHELGLGTAAIGVIGADSVRMPMVPHHHHVTLTTELPKAELRYVTPKFEALRRVQSAEEVEWLRKGAEFTDLAMEAMVNALRPGVREYELYAAQHGAYLPRGGQIVFSIMSSTSMSTPRSPHPFPWPSERKLAKGDILLTEISASYWGYSGQAIRAVAIGEPPDQYREFFDIAKQAYLAIQAELKPGNTAADVQRAGDVISDAGYTSLGPLVHGWGLGLAEPYIGLRGTDGWSSEPMPFEEHQTLMIQPNVTSHDKTGGIILGNLNRVTPDGGESYQRFPLDFIVR